MAAKLVHLNSVGGVEITDPSEGQILVYQYVGGKFVNSTPKIEDSIETTGWGVATNSLKVSAQTSPDMTIQVAGGVVHLVTGYRKAIPATASITVTAADATNGRIDAVYVASDGTVTYTTGTPGANPTAPSVPGTAILLAHINVAAGQTTIINDNITDKRRIKFNFTGTLDGNANKMLVVNADGTSVTVQDIPSGVTDHTLLSNIGTKTHLEIDGHIDNTENPHGVTAAQIGAAAVDHDHATLYAALLHDHTGVYAPVLHDHAGTYEPALGNPSTDGYILSSTAAGVRTWIPPGTGNGSVDSVNGQTGAVVLDAEDVGAATSVHDHAKAVGNANTAIGSSALAVLTTGGNYNTAIGDHALNKNTTGTGNMAIGSYPLYNNITGGNNFAFGQQSLYASTGDRNFGIGNFALYSMTAGANNIAIGQSAGYNGLTNNDNVFIGYMAGYGVADSTGTTNNVTIGNYAGQGLQNGAICNTLIGNSAGSSITTGNYNIMLGYNAQPATPTTSYELNIYDAFFGNLQSKKFGIGARPTTYAFEITGDISVTGNYRVNGNPLSAASVNAEPSLGNPASDDMVLSSKADGTRSWKTVSSGGGVSFSQAATISMLIGGM